MKILASEWHEISSPWSYGEYGDLVRGKRFIQCHVVQPDNCSTTVPMINLVELCHDFGWPMEPFKKDGHVFHYGVISPAMLYSVVIIWHNPQDREHIFGDRARTFCTNIMGCAAASLDSYRNNVTLEAYWSEYMKTPHYKEWLAKTTAYRSEDGAISDKNLSRFD